MNPLSHVKKSDNKNHFRKSLTRNVKYCKWNRTTQHNQNQWMYVLSKWKCDKWLYNYWIIGDGARDCGLRLIPINKGRLMLNLLTCLGCTLGYDKRLSGGPHDIRSTVNSWFIKKRTANRERNIPIIELK